MHSFALFPSLDIGAGRIVCFDLEILNISSHTTDVVKVMTKDSYVSEHISMFLHFILHQPSSEANEFEDKIKMGT